MNTQQKLLFCFSQKVLFLWLSLSLLKTWKKHSMFFPIDKQTNKLSKQLLWLLHNKQFKQKIFYYYTIFCYQFCVYIWSNVAFVPIQIMWYCNYFIDECTNLQEWMRLYFSFYYLLDVSKINFTLFWEKCCWFQIKI